MPDSRFDARPIVEASRLYPGYSAEWQDLIEDVARRYVMRDIASRQSPALKRKVDAAVQAGCRDPFIRNLHLRWQINTVERPTKAQAAEMCEIAGEIYRLPYPAAIKAYVACRTHLVWRMAYQLKGEDDTSRRLHYDMWRAVMAAIRAPETTEAMARDLSVDIAHRYLNSKGGRDEAMKKLQDVLRQRFGDCGTIHYLNGYYAYHRGWDARGRGYASTVTDEGWELFRQELSLAKEELETAWSLDPSDPDTAKLLIDVHRGLGLPRAEMEKWFRAGLATGWDCDALCRAKLNYLAPKWHGSLAEQLAFARECLAHPEWSDNIGCLLAKVHEDYGDYRKELPEYLGTPEVWRDIRLSYEAHFEKFPDVMDLRLKYAFAAWQAREWGILHDQLRRIDPNLIWLEEIGGAEVYARMVGEAKAHASAE